MTKTTTVSQDLLNQTSLKKDAPPRRPTKIQGDRETFLILMGITVFNVF